MRFAIYVPNFGTFGDVLTVVELAKSAEQAGWDGFFLWDHHLPDGDSLHGPVADPWVTMAAIATATSHLRIGALVTPIPRRRPWKLAREATTLDHLSAGRLVVGAGIGGDWWREYSAFGEPADAQTHGAMLDEGLDVLAGLWTGEPFSYSGKHYTIDQAQFLPKPVQSPRIPVWVAGVWPGTRPFRRAARWDGVFPLGRNGDPSPNDIREMAAYIQRYRTATTPFDIAISGQAHAKPEAERASYLAEYAAAGLTWWLEAAWGTTPLSEIQKIIAEGPTKL